MWWWLLVCPLPRLHCFLLPGQVVSTSGQPSLLFLDTGFNFSWHRVYTSMTPSLLFHDTGFNLSWQRVCTFMTPSLHVHDIGFKLPWRRVHKFRTMHLNFHDAEFTLSWHRVYTFMTPSFNFHDTEFTLPWHRVYTSMTPSLHFHDAEFTLSWRRVSITCHDDRCTNFGDRVFFSCLFLMTLTVFSKTTYDFTCTAWWKSFPFWLRVDWEFALPVILSGIVRYRLQFRKRWNCGSRSGP